MLRAEDGKLEYTATADRNGQFVFAALEPGSYRITLRAGQKEWAAREPLAAHEQQLTGDLQVLPQGDALLVVPRTPSATPENQTRPPSSKDVSNIPLNERDFSNVPLLAAGTITGTNGAADFTQQFSTNGQRGVTSVFAIDGADSSDPEMGGATFANFNVDAIQEVQSSSAVMPADIGHQGAAMCSAFNPTSKRLLLATRPN